MIREIRLEIAAYEIKLAQEPLSTNKMFFFRKIIQEQKYIKKEKTVFIEMEKLKATAYLHQYYNNDDNKYDNH